MFIAANSLANYNSNLFLSVLKKSNPDEPLPEPSPYIKNDKLLLSVYEKLNIYINQIREHEADKSQQEQYKLIAQTTQMFAHDVRKPFTLIESVIDLIEGENDLNILKPIIITLASELREEQVKIEAMIQDLLEFKPYKKLEKTKNHLVDIIDSSLSNFESKYQKNVNLTLPYKKRDVYLHCDKNKIERVISNLISNAVDEMSHRDTLTIDIEQNSKDIIISVTNTGSFIPQDIRDKLLIYLLHKEKRAELA